MTPSSETNSVTISLRICFLLWLVDGAGTRRAAQTHRRCAARRSASAAEGAQEPPRAQRGAERPQGRAPRPAVLAVDDAVVDDHAPSGARPAQLVDARRRRGP